MAQGAELTVATGCCGRRVLAFQSKVKLVKLDLSLQSIKHLLQNFKFLPFVNGNVGSGLSANLWEGSIIDGLDSALMNFSVSPFYVLHGNRN